MKRSRRPGGPCTILLLGLALSPMVTVAPASSSSDNEITGDYRYTYHDPETTATAKAHACREAAKAAVKRSPAFRDATAYMVDSPLVQEAAEAVVRDALKDVQIIAQTEKASTVSCTIRGMLDPQEVTQIVTAQAQARSEGSQPASDQNRAVKILRVEEDSAGNVLIVFQALRRLDWLSTAYQGSLREQADIMVEFFGEQGRLLSQARYPARKTDAGDDVMNPGQIGVRTIPKPSGTKSYRVSVSK